MTTILTFMSYYLPGFRAGGPIRTVANMVERLGDEFRFKVVTRDRDIIGGPYETVEPGRWSGHGGAEVMHLDPARQTMSALTELLHSTPHDLLYFNSLFDPALSIRPALLRRLGRVERRPLVIAPRGEFARGALGFKSLRKRLFLAGARLTGLHRDVLWQASTVHEEADVRRSIGDGARVHVARDLAPAASEPPQRKRAKRAGELRALFLSRVSYMKNLEGALGMLEGLRGEVRYDIYGPVDDREYWERCRARVDGLPANVKVEYHGDLPHERVLETMAAHDLFFLPTHGENYGHVIHEALLAGCPVLISDRTPWRELESKGVGWDLPLEEPERFTRTLQDCVDMDAESHARLSQEARRLAERAEQDADALEQNRELFRLALGAGS
jgi:glycosyltransferase involved in cell wall biosynthesis